LEAVLCWTVALPPSRGWEYDALSIDEFEEFGPVQHFRDSFVAGWNSLLAAVGKVTAHEVVS
jgi:hypothetical protein